MNTYYMPAGLLPFETWVINFGTVGAAGSVPITVVTVLEWTNFNALVSEYSAALAISTAPATRTPVTVATTQDWYNQVREACRELVARIQAWTGLSESIATDLGITFRKTTKTPIAPPTAVPSLDVNRVLPLAVELRVRELGAELSALPPFCVGYQVRYALDLPMPPMSPDNLELIGTGTRRFFTKEFDAGDVGKQAYFAVRYVTAKQLFGPWSNIVATTVVSG